MQKMLIMTAIAALGAFTVACGGGGTSSSDKTATAIAGRPVSTATTGAAASPTKAGEAPTENTEATAVGTAPSKADLAQDVTTLKAILQQVIAKAQAGDVQGTRDTEGTMDDSIEAIVKATKSVDATLADQIETRELDIEHQADASTTDLTIIAKDAQEILPLLDQVVTTLGLPSAEAAPSTPNDASALAKDVTTLRGIMQQVIAKAQSGDVQGTRDVEGTMDDSIEAIVKATKSVDPNLSDEIETRELDIEHQADASTTDLNVIAKDAQEILPLLDQVATTMKLST
jgi:hypothetical protein